MFTRGRGFTVAGAPWLALVIRMPVRARKGIGPAAGPWRFGFPLGVGASCPSRCRPAPRSPELQHESPFLFSAWDNGRNTAWSQKQPCRWGLWPGSEVIARGLQCEQLSFSSWSSVTFIEQLLDPCTQLSLLFASLQFLLTIIPRCVAALLQGYRVHDFRARTSEDC